MDASTIILGFTGSIRSGCTYIAYALPDVAKLEYKYFKLSGVIREALSKEGIENPTIEQMQDKGNQLRRQYGRGYLVGELIKKVQDDPDLEQYSAFIIDGIKNEGEIQSLQQFPYFFLFSVQSTGELRLERHLEKGTEEEFFKADKRDQLEEEYDYGQQVKKCNYLADIIVLNDRKIPRADENTKTIFISDIYTKYVKPIENLKSGERSATVKPSMDELSMTIAYSLSKMSSCIKRKVGAVVVDFAKSNSTSNSPGQITTLPFIVSSGYNEVPLGSYGCIFHPDYEMCYRDFLQQNHSMKFKFCPNCGEKINIKIQCPSCDEIYMHFVKSCRNCQQEIEDTFQCEKCGSEVFKEYLPGGKETPGKLLDMCRSLHAEENALLKLDTNSSSQNLTLYVTTQPCNLCSNKIVATGIKKVVFDEPYLIPEAADILRDGDVEVQRFEGIKSSAYFKLYQ